jgi:hypothetical protein
MKKTTSLFAAALAALLTLPALGAAQALESGIWTGTASAPDGEVAITFDVKVSGDTIAITLNAGEHGSFKLEEVKLVEKKLSFWFTPGPKVVCELNRRDDGAFAGNCTDDGGTLVPMTMIPPKKGTGAPDYR